MKFYEVNYKVFNCALDKSVKLGFLHKYDYDNNETTLKGYKFYLSNGKKVGVGLSNTGEIINLFNNSKVSGAGRLALNFAIAKGGTHLSCFDGFLRWYYQKFGFECVKQIPWDSKYAPKNWDYKKYGTPDVIYMVLL